MSVESMNENNKTHIILIGATEKSEMKGIHHGRPHVLWYSMYIR